MIYVGVVENRLDPLKLGRHQVRVFGVHSESKENIPTESLPWAITLMPGTSASVSGIGHSGSGFVEGTFVLVVFQDGDSKQQPIVLGSFHGIPLSQTPFTTQLDSDVEAFFVNETVDNTEQVEETPPPSVANDPAKPEEPKVSPSTLRGNITAEQKAKLMAALGKRESGNNYKAVNQIGYIGKYQFGAPALTDLGYVKKGTTNKTLTDPANWTGKDGIKSREDFLANIDVQEKVMSDYIDVNTKRLYRQGTIDSNTPYDSIAGYLATSHLLGSGGAAKLKKGIVKADANGVKATEYYNLGFKAVSGNEPVVSPENVTKDTPPSTDTKSASSNSSVQKRAARQVQNFGFQDPELKYPRYVNEQDTNRLSRHQKINQTIVGEKDGSRDLNVQKANGKGNWSEPKVPYNAKYPFNHVYESESGHVMEFDDTPKNERIHIYHKSGTFQEIDTNGSEVRKIIGDKYEIWERNGYVHIKGVCNITVEGDANILVGNNADIEVGNDTNLNMGGTLNATADGDMKFACGGSFYVNPLGSFNVLSGGVSAIDASAVYLNSGVASGPGISPKGLSGNGPNDFDVLDTPDREFEDVAEIDDGTATPEQAAAKQQELINRGVADPNDTTSVNKSESVGKNGIQGSAVDHSNIEGLKKVPMSTQLSPNFKLADLCQGGTRPLQAQGGRTEEQIAKNLQCLSQNILEVVKKSYPDMEITSGFRTGSGASQHERGQAVDIRFPRRRASEYPDIAKDLASKLPYDQLILEYNTPVRKNNGDPSVWIHISYNCESKSQRKQLFTMNKHSRVGNFGELKTFT